MSLVDFSPREVNLAQSVDFLDIPFKEGSNIAIINTNVACDIE